MAEASIRPTSVETQRTDPTLASVIPISQGMNFRPATEEKRQPLDIDQLYSVGELAGSNYRRRGLSLISNALAHVDNALELNAERDRVGSDDAMQHFHVLLPELFACRSSLGEGFGLIISSLQNATLQLRGQALEEPQIRAVRSALAGLRSEPFMSFDAALAQISRLENTGLNVDPPNFECLADLLSE